MQSRTIHLLVLAMLVTSVAVALVPTAQAQRSTVITITLSPPTESVKPLQGTLTFGGTYTLTADQTGQTNIVGIPIALTVSKQPSWAQVVVSPSNDVVVGPGTGQQSPQYTITRPFTVAVTASDQAPAFQPDTIEITITATPPAPGVGTSGKATVPIQAAYFSIIDVQLAEAIKVERPQTPVVFPLKVSNFGNANTKVTFDILDKSETLVTQLPTPIVLQSKQAGGNQITADVPLTIQTPYKNGYLNEVGVVNYQITSAYALDPKLKGDETRVSVVITTKGFYVPGVELPLLVGMLGLGALLLRRRV